MNITNIHRAFIEADIDVEEVIPSFGKKPGKIKISRRLFLHVYENEIRVGIKNGRVLSFYLAKDLADAIQVVKQLQRPSAHIETVSLCKKCDKPGRWLNRQHTCRACLKENQLKQWPKYLELG